MAIGNHAGSCQCGAVRVSGRFDLDGAVACNCSRCRRMGWMLVFAPETAVAVEGEDATTEFLFNRHAISHRFCATCGVQVYARGATPSGDQMVAVNLNCLDGVEPWTLSVHRVDGASS